MYADMENTFCRLCQHTGLYNAELKLPLGILLKFSKTKLANDVISSKINYNYN